MTDIGLIGGADGPTALFVVGSVWKLIALSTVFAAAIIAVLLYLKCKK